MAVKGYLVFVPLENVATMEYGSNGAPDKATVATTPGHLAGPFNVAEIVRDPLAGETAAVLESAGLPPEEGTVRTRSAMDGFTDVETRVIPAGVLQVTSCYQAIRMEDAELGERVAGWQCTLREARLNGELVLDPHRAQALADEAGITPPGAFLEAL